MQCSFNIKSYIVLVYTFPFNLVVLKAVEHTRKYSTYMHTRGSNNFNTINSELWPVKSNYDVWFNLLFKFLLPRYCGAEKTIATNYSNNPVITYTNLLRVVFNYLKLKPQYCL